MTAESDRFEQQVERIHSLVEGDSATVTWNDRLPDPDNPAQLRQIDVTVRDDGALTLIECRIHAVPQDVTWIEELIGRRASMQADAVIAVSASGFTRGAILKAEAHGIILRDLASLSEEEIRSWGRRTDVSFELIRFQNVAIRFCFPPEAQGLVSIDDVERALVDGSIALAPMFDKLVEQVREAYPDWEAMGAEASFTPRGMFIGGRELAGIDLAAEILREEVPLSTPSIVAYDLPAASALERNVYVELVEGGQFEITRASDQAAVAVDLSAIPIPRGAKLGRMSFRFDRPVEIREFNLLGKADTGFWLGAHEISITFE